MIVNHIFLPLDLRKMILTERQNIKLGVKVLNASGIQHISGIVHVFSTRKLTYRQLKKSFGLYFTNSREYFPIVGCSAIYAATKFCFGNGVVWILVGVIL